MRLERLIHSTADGVDKQRLHTCVKFFQCVWSVHAAVQTVNSQSRLACTPQIASSQAWGVLFLTCRSDGISPTLYGREGHLAGMNCCGVWLRDSD